MRQGLQGWIALALLALAAPIGAAVPGRSSHPLWGNLSPGDYGVGFKRIWQLDTSRVWSRSPAIDSETGTVARPLRIDVWYPASCDGSDVMPLSGYVEIASPGPAFDDLVFLTHRWDTYSYHGLAKGDDSYDELMEAKTGACLHAPAANGRFPLVVYSAGWFNRSPDNSILGEYLASHGFVVATVPQLNPGLWTYNFTSDARSVENQIRDLEVAIGALIDDPSVDRTHVAAMGYSTGGDVALLLQGRNPLVDAVVGLDASWTLSSDNDVAGSAFFLPARHKVPLLALRRPTDDTATADQVLESLTAAPRLVVEIPGADHGTFSDDPPEQSLLGAGSADAVAKHTAMARAVREFLHAVLDGGSGGFDAASLAALYQREGLVPSFRPAETAPEDATDPPAQ